MYFLYTLYPDVCPCFRVWSRKHFRFTFLYLTIHSKSRKYGHIKYIRCDKAFWIQHAADKLLYTYIYCYWSEKRSICSIFPLKLSLTTRSSFLRCSPHHSPNTFPSLTLTFHLTLTNSEIVRQQAILAETTCFMYCVLRNVRNSVYGKRKISWDKQTVTSRKGVLKSPEDRAWKKHSSETPSCSLDSLHKDFFFLKA